MNAIRLLAALCVASLFAACASAPPPRAPAVEDPALRARFEAAQQAREQALAADTEWSLGGRIAALNAGRGGSGRLDWQQRRDGFEVSVSAPVTRQGWRLSAGPDGALLEGVEGGPRRGFDARMLLLEATGWDVPLRALPAWIRGLREPALGPARIEYGTDGLPRYMEQDGWRIQYHWPPATGDGTRAGPVLPDRVEATRGEARVRLVVDEWMGVDG